MPQRFAIGRAQRQNAAKRISGKREAGIGRKNSRASASRAEFMRPADLTRLIVDCFQNALTPNAIIRACPAECAVLRFGEVDAVAGMRVDNEEARLWIEAGRTVIRHAAFIGSNQATVAGGL